MTHVQYIRNVEYKIDSLFNEYNEIDTNINILAINSNHQMLTEGYTPDDIYYGNIDYVVEATEAKKGILGKIIDGIMKIIRTIVEKVKTFFSKNKPDSKAKISVSKSLETRTNKLIKLKPKILKGLALVGTVGAGALTASKIANEVKNEVEDVKEEKKKDSKKNKSNVTEFKFDTVKVTQRIKELTEVLVKINERITKLSNELDTMNCDGNLRYTISVCNKYVSEVNDTVNEILTSLNNGQEDLARNITKSSEMHKFNRTKHKVMSDINATKSRAVEKSKARLGPAFDEFEKIDREKKHPKGKELFNDLKKLQHFVLNPDKYNRDEYTDEYDRLETAINRIYYKTRDLNPEYERITDKIKTLCLAIHTYNNNE
jgi:hypothetical protein